MALKTTSSILVNRTVKLIGTTRNSSSTSKLQQILTKFPSKNLSFAFAYGSGVKKQLGYGDNEPEITIQPSTTAQHHHHQQQQQQKQQKPQNMIDIMFCVQNPLEWHTENFKMNPKHYSGVGQNLGPAWITKIQETFGAKVYCNTLIDLSENVVDTTVGSSGSDGPVIKYGVISEKHLTDDLLNWSYLYVAGRLQKPVDILKIPPSQQLSSKSMDSGYCIQEAIDKNLSSAIHTALLLLPHHFSVYQLFYTIANLSYAGDFRMIFGEKKDKVKNIVTPQLAQFLAYYSPTLKIFKSLDCVSSVPFLSSDNGVNIENSAAAATGITSSIEQNKSQEMVYHHLKNLPKTVRDRLVKSVNKTTTKSTTEVIPAAEEEQVLEEISRKYSSTQLVSLLDQEIRAIVWNSSVSQSIKNIPTAGISKSIQYSYRKVLKTFNM